MNFGSTIQNTVNEMKKAFQLMNSKQKKIRTKNKRLFQNPSMTNYAKNLRKSGMSKTNFITSGFKLKKMRKND